MVGLEEIYSTDKELMDYFDEQLTAIRVTIVDKELRSKK
jgi:hypothetical protein